GAFVARPRVSFPIWQRASPCWKDHKSADQIGQRPKVVVPSSAVVERSGTKHVFVVDEDQVRLTPVDLGAAFGPGYELVRGPGIGARVVKNPPPTLRDGHRIKESKR